MMQTTHSQTGFLILLHEPVLKPIYFRPKGGHIIEVLLYIYSNPEPKPHFHQTSPTSKQFISKFLNPLLYPTFSSSRLFVSISSSWFSLTQSSSSVRCTSSAGGTVDLFFFVLAALSFFRDLLYSFTLFLCSAGKASSNINNQRYH